MITLFPSTIIKLEIAFNKVSMLLTVNEIAKIIIIIDKKRALIPFPITIAKATAIFFEFFPNPMLTIDQLNLLKYDNVLSGNSKSNIDINYNCSLTFEKEVEKYCYMWREHGEYSRKKFDIK